MIAGQDRKLEGSPERRSMRRFDMRLPAAIRVSGGNGGEEWVTETRNVSARGLFFYSNRPLTEGARLEVTLTFPPHITFTESVRIRFTARVVRVEAESQEHVGVAAMIEEYEFLKSLRDRVPGREDDGGLPSS